MGNAAGHSGTGLEESVDRPCCSTWLSNNYIHGAYSAIYTIDEDDLRRSPTSISGVSSGELPMPVYEFKCKKCDHRFEMTESIGKHDKHREKCPQCGSRSIQNIVGMVNVKTAKKS